MLWIVTDQETKYHTVDWDDRCLDQHSESSPRAAAATSASLNSTSLIAVSVGALARKCGLTRAAAK